MTSGLLATLAFVGVAGAQMSAPLKVSISTPSSGSLVGKNGLGWNVDFGLSSAATNSSMALSVANGYLPGYSAPGSATFKPGRSAFAPGLVVLCGTTVNSTAFPGGPNTNLAGLFSTQRYNGNDLYRRLLLFPVRLAGRSSPLRSRCTFQPHNLCR